MPAKRKANKGRPTKQARRPTNNNNNNTTDDYEQHTNSVLALADPFSSFARGARQPDIGASRTVTETIRQMVSITTDDAGFGGMLFQGSAAFCALPMLSYSAGTFTADDAFISVGPNATATQSRARIVSWGIRAVNLQSATESKGQLCLLKLGRATVGGTYTVNPALYANFEAHPLRHGGEWTIVSYIRGNESLEWYNFSDSDPVDQQGSSAWDTLGIFILGSQAESAVVSVELYMNTEYIVSDDDPLSQYARTQPVYNPMLLAAVNHVHSNHPGLVAAGKEAIGRELRQHAKTAARKHLVPALKKFGKAALFAAV